MGKMMFVLNFEQMRPLLLKITNELFANICCRAYRYILNQKYH